MSRPAEDSAAMLRSAAIATTVVCSVLLLSACGESPMGASEGASTAPDIVARVKQHVHTGEKVLVALDSNHGYAHVSAELAAYAPLVTPGSYIIATDGLMRDLAGAPRGDPNWTRDNPAQAAEDFVAKHSDFVLEEPRWKFNESTLAGNVTHWPSAWLKRVQ